MLNYAPLEVVIVFFAASPLILISIKRKYSIIKKLCSALLVLYIVFAVKLFFFPIGFDQEVFPAFRFSINLIPFHDVSNLGISAFLFQIIGNILAFMPLSFLLCMLYPRCRKFKTSLTTALAASVIVELTQLVINFVTQVSNRAVDITDVVTNTIGGILGYACYCIANSIFHFESMGNSGNTDASAE